MLSILLQYLRCLQSARGIFRSAKKLITPEKEPSGRGHHRGIRVLEELVEPWGDSAAEVDEGTWVASEVIEACKSSVCILHSHYRIQFC
jgi:hypothetical protein